MIVFDFNEHDAAGACQGTAMMITFDGCSAVLEITQAGDGISVSLSFDNWQTRTTHTMPKAEHPMTMANRCNEWLAQQLAEHPG